MQGELGCFVKKADVNWIKNYRLKKYENNEKQAKN